MKLKIIFVLFLSAAAAFAKTSQPAACSQNSDCEVGCVDVKEGANCYLKSQIKIKTQSDGQGECRTGPGGLLCGCKNEKCAYMSPADFSSKK